MFFVLSEWVFLRSEEGIQVLINVRIFDGFDHLAPIQPKLRQVQTLNLVRSVISYFCSSSLLLKKKATSSDGMRERGLSQ